eukprot:1158975-Pelagomonas_calceolata.AAC.6
MSSPPCLPRPPLSKALRSPATYSSFEWISGCWTGCQAGLLQPPSSEALRSPATSSSHEAISGCRVSAMPHLKGAAAGKTDLTSCRGS